MKPGDFEDLSASKILQFVQGVGLLYEWGNGLHERSITVGVLGSLYAHPSAVCSIPIDPTQTQNFRVLIV
jgi:hypothetical protein